MGCSVKQHADGMQGSQRSEIQSVEALPRQVHVHLVEDAVAQVSLLIQGPFDGVALSLGKE